MNTPVEKELKDFRLLIVEDAEMNRFIIDKILRTTGCTFTIASTGEEALVLMQNGRYDVVLLDIELPGLNGYGVASAIRKITGNTTKAPKIIAMTGHLHQDEQDRSVSSGMDGWIVKPFDLKDLKEAILKTQEKDTCPEPQDSPLVNLDILNSIAGDDPAFIGLCIELFLKEMPENLNRLETAIEAVDWETIRTTSHKMKTSLNYMGLAEQRKAALNIEKLAREKRDIRRIKSDANEIIAVCKLAFQELRETLHKKEEKAKS